MLTGIREVATLSGRRQVAMLTDLRDVATRSGDRQVAILIRIRRWQHVRVQSEERLGLGNRRVATSAGREGNRRHSPGSNGWQHWLALTDVGIRRQEVDERTGSREEG